jgi:site-specific recombinase XerD
MQALAPGFQEYLRDERGMRPDTLRGYEHHLRVFERFLAASRIVDLSKLTPAWVTRFLLESTVHMSRWGRQGRAGAMRVLLRYLHRQGIIATDLSRAVPRGRGYTAASIPRAIPWSEVERVLASIDRRDARGKRDYAILMLLAIYGLRSQEVAKLELSAIDWQRSQFHVLGRKAGNSTTYPLAASVGTAIIEYLRVRPQCADPHVFVTLMAPYHSIGHWAVSGRASHYLQRAGITIRRAGSHTFRHSCVQRLVEADVPFKQIGDYVGHRSEDATAVYAKVALHKLRALTLGDAEDIL